MKFILIILFPVLSFAQLPKCVQPTVQGSFTGTVTLPSNNYTFGLIATAYNGEGISSYSYSILTGSGTLVNANSQSASITNLTQGITSVRLIVSDSCGAKDTSNIIITVNPAPLTQLIITAKATPNVLQGQTSTVLSLTANYPVSQWWQDSIGPNQATLSIQANASCTASNLIPGTYYFTYSATTQATNPSQTVKGIVVVIVNSAYTLTLVPNPARNTVTASLTGSGTGAVKIDLYNVSGTRILQQKSGTKAASTFSATFSMNYKSGTYPMTAILNGATVATAKLIIL